MDRACKFAIFGFDRFVSLFFLVEINIKISGSLEKTWSNLIQSNNFWIFDIPRDDLFCIQNIIRNLDRIYDFFGRIHFFTYLSSFVHMIFGRIIKTGRYREIRNNWFRFVQDEHAIMYKKIEKAG